MLRYAITARQIFPGDEPERRNALVVQAHRLANRGIDVLQVRERDLSERELIDLTRRIVEAVQSVGGAPMKILVNGPAHVAVAAGADGVHLRGRAGANDLEHALQTFETSGLPTPLVSVSCHTVEEARQAALDGFDLILFGPVFEKRVGSTLITPGLGLDQLRRACGRIAASAASRNPHVLALGGVDQGNARQCRDAGAAGIAGIRMFL